jgi:hypothetical protein
MTKEPRRNEKPQSPMPEWLPLQRAYFFFRSGGDYLRSAEDWQVHAASVIDAFAEEDAGEHPEPFHIDPVAEDRTLEIRAYGMVLTISPSTGRFALAPERFEDEDDDNLVRLEGEAWEFLEKCRAHGAPSHLAVGVDWHARLAEHLLQKQTDALSAAVKRGEAYVMARVNDVRSSFERLLPDQLDYFFAVPKRGSEADALRRQQALLRASSEGSPSGVGPGGAKLFSIHIAPSPAALTGRTSLEKCRDWLKQLAAENPHVRPDTKAKLLGIARNRFGDIPARAFERLLLKHQPESWTRPGRPRRIPAGNQDE